MHAPTNSYKNKFIKRWNIFGSDVNQLKEYVQYNWWYLFSVKIFDGENQIL